LSAKKAPVATSKTTIGSTSSYNDYIIKASPPPVPPGCGLATKSLSRMKDAASNNVGEHKSNEQKKSGIGVEKPE
jgi:hypothetical protein